jgi:hypothetical protein
MACLTAATLAGAATAQFAIACALNQEILELSAANLDFALRIGGVGGQFVGLATSLAAIGFGEVRGKTVHALKGAGWAAGIAALLGVPLWMWASIVAGC